MRRYKQRLKMIRRDFILNIICTKRLRGIPFYIRTFDNWHLQGDILGKEAKKHVVVLKNIKMTVFLENICSKCCTVAESRLHLYCVFHGIRFKVKKMGCRETTFFVFIRFHVRCETDQTGVRAVFSIALFLCPLVTVFMKDSFLSYI